MPRTIRSRIPHVLYRLLLKGGSVQQQEEEARTIRLVGHDFRGRYIHYCRLQRAWKPRWNSSWAWECQSRIEAWRQSFLGNLMPRIQWCYFFFFSEHYFYNLITEWGILMYFAKIFCWINERAYPFESRTWRHSPPGTNSVIKFLCSDLMLMSLHFLFFPSLMVHFN